MKRFKETHPLEEAEEWDFFRNLEIKGSDGKSLDPEFNDLACLMAGNIHAIDGACDPHYAMQIADGLWPETDECRIAADIIFVIQDQGWRLIPPQTNWAGRIALWIQKLLRTGLD